ncbi:conjugal transfer protein [Salmonella enterica subsp. enterica serovar Give]|uniref:TrbM/KikA/MpfK family conjugal transfer protein n=1 Tax=Salmonella enterica TaxID=28901 RepID=UPI0009B0C19A|nr:TrbM/KikA/MpfK family conjugal transfer protein [Salmonella enterica]EAB9751969.1 conjugal transfer protein [Salmonella enterica subsp. salamae]EBZ2217479.1 conjugal transfer protein [Salmonella enterica subsp. enterica serovar Montevideo]ECA5182798.1 conjugal transfer protein [Salmonella enterica subsp. enterica serovar Newport]ECD3769241.1 conjugal transfer protein [Salmonella enterica subsp. enterica serovar Onderstepoort]ECI2685728.1 conjugal transfer protein [Salmonella enterica subsp.
MRKTKAIFTAIVFSLGVGNIPAYASDPCASVLCLYGKAVGQGGGSECRSAEKDFFNILKKKKGSIRWSKTFDARKAFLSQCSTADPAAIAKIMGKFGRSRG